MATRHATPYARASCLFRRAHPDRWVAPERSPGAGTVGCAGDPFGELQLELHPQKTKIVYCKDANGRGTYPEYRFDFLGYTFRPRRAKARKGKLFVGFMPALSNEGGQEYAADHAPLAAASVE